MQCHICIFFIYKYLCDILWLYAQSSNSCLIKCITPIDIFGFAIEFDSSSCQRIRDAIALAGVRNSCNL